jgi:mRNA interferase YafQ
MYRIDRSVKLFRRSVRTVAKRGYDMSKLERTIDLLASGNAMPTKYLDHSLKGNYIGYRECHVDGNGDWLLIYKKDHGLLILVLTATGTHSDLFD